MMHFCKARPVIKSYSVCIKNNQFSRKISFLNWGKNKTAEPLSSVSVNTAASENFYLPEPPNAPDIVESVITYNSLGEATFQSLGLNSWWPTGWVQAGYEALHVSLDMPWWSAIAISAILARAVMLPITIRLRKLNVANSEVTPLLAAVEKRAKDAYIVNDYVSMARASEDHSKIMATGKFKPYKILFYTMLQFPIFMSVMIGLRQMAQLPVASLQTGGVFWFSDLTMPDPYYILPVCTMLLFWLQMEVGADFGANSLTTSPYKKWGVRAIPAIGAVLTCNFPSALLLYWWCSSALSLTVVGAMKMPVLKRLFGTVDVVKAPVTVAAAPSQGIIKEWKQKSSERKIFDTVTKISSIDNEKWIKAGTGVVPKTFTYDPTKVAATKKE